MGANVTAAGVRFRVWAPSARQVDVVLAGGDRGTPLEKETDGVWSVVVPEARPGTRYRYRLNKDLLRPDPYSRYQPEGVHGPSEVVDPTTFVWHDTGWPGLFIQGLVIYEAHVGTATPEGTLDSLIGQLPRLRVLGVSAIQLLPLAEFPGTRNWGYDGVDLFSVAHVYGGPDALRRFVDAAHAHRLGVILDVVYNHFGPDGNYLRDYAREYFTDRHHTPWGEAIDYSNPWARQLILDNARFWISEYHADGLRLDATHAIFDCSPIHILAELTTSVRRSVDDKASTVLIAENYENNARYLRPVAEGGFGLDAVYADDFHHTLRRYLVGDHEGYYADYAGTLEEVARCIQQGWLYEGEPTPRSGMKQRRGTAARDRPAWQFLYVTQNHDQVGNRALGERLNQQIDLDRFAAASALLLFLPYTPMVFMGQEFAASTPFQFFTDHNAELGKLVTEGRRREFAAFSAFADPSVRERIPDPQALSTFANSKLRLEEADAPPGSTLQRWYEDLLRLRRTDPVLVDQARERMEARALSRDTIAVRRWREAEERLLVVNFGDPDFSTNEFGNGWRVILQSQRVLTPGKEPDAVHVPGRAAAILARSAP
jgi:maltooligosyltrehalose trehalohydrolase